MDAKIRLLNTDKFNTEHLPNYNNQVLDAYIIGDTAFVTFHQLIDLGIADSVFRKETFDSEFRYPFSNKSPHFRCEEYDEWEFVEQEG